MRTPLGSIRLCAVPYSPEHAPPRNPPAHVHADVDALVQLTSMREKRFESFLEDHLQDLIAPFGHIFLIIGRQVFVESGKIDLLALARDGTLYVIEVKFVESPAKAPTQGFSYRRATRILSREQLISIARNCEIDLERSFRRRFGKALPKSVNRRQVILIIAVDLSDHTARSIVDLREIEKSEVYAFRFDRRPDSIGLVPCARNESDLRALSHRQPSGGLFAPRPVGRTHPSSPQVQKFWSWMSPRIAAPVVKLRTIYRRYEGWFATESRKVPGLKRVPQGIFSLQLNSIVWREGIWKPVYLRSQDNVDPDRLPLELPTMRFKRDARHTQSGYARVRAFHINLNTLSC